MLNTIKRIVPFRLTVLALASGLSVPVLGLSLVDDNVWSVRWDNTFKYQAVFRTEGSDEEIYKTDPGGTARPPLIGQSTRSFDRSNLGLISNRLDWRTEVDVIWKETAGFRISAAAWYDDVYNKTNDFSVTPGIDNWNGLTYAPNEFSDDTQRWHGKNAELLDAFVFANWSLGNVDGNVRLGRHTIYYGTSLLPTGVAHSVAGAMTQLDTAKGLGSPGTEAKELFLPSNKISTVIQFSENLTLNAFYGLEFQRTRSSSPGAYWSIANGFTDDNEFGALFPGGNGAPRIGLTQMDAEEPDDAGSNYGFSLQYYMEDIDADVAFHYVKGTKTDETNLVGNIDFRKFLTSQGAPLDGLASALVGIGLATAEDIAPIELASTNGPAVSIGNYQWAFAEDIDTYGVSFSKEISGISVGVDLNYIDNAQLRGDLNRMLFRFNNVPDPADAPTDAIGDIVAENLQAVSDAVGFPVSADNNFNPEDVSPGNSKNPRGNVYTAVVNGLGLLNSGSIWDGGTYIFELTFSHLAKITENEYFISQGDAAYKEGGISTHGAFVFRPVWYQVMPSIDLTIPFSIGYGLHGNSAIGPGFNHQGDASIGASLDVRNAYQVELRYSTRFGSVDNSLVGLLKDRDNIAFTVKATF
jgi:hypothetical protein